MAAALGLTIHSAPEWSRIAMLNRITGAPYVEVDGVAVDLDVSLTDRAGHAVCLVGPSGSMRSGTLGADLEIVEPRSPGFVADYFTPVEQAWVAEVARAGSAGSARSAGSAGSGGAGSSGDSGQGYDVAANLIWSAKEAALKVVQVGLRADTRTVEVTISGDVLNPGSGWWPLTAHLRGGGIDRLGMDLSELAMTGWWRRDGDYLLTTAARMPFDEPQVLPGSLDLGTAVPTHSWLANPVAPPLMP